MEALEAKKHFYLLGAKAGIKKLDEVIDMGLTELVLGKTY